MGLHSPASTVVVCHTNPPCGEPTVVGHRKSEPYLVANPPSWGTANPNLTLWRTHPRGAPQIRTLPWWPTLVGHRKYEYEKNTASQKKLLVSQLHKTPSEPCTVSSSTDHRLVRACECRC